MLEILKRELDAVQSDTESDDLGLSEQEAAQRLLRDGANTIGSKKKSSALKIFANQFHDVMVMIL
ncbi:MAG: hypothetical protein IJM75_08080, partial [Ruminococcus sp.]|nr:hypothetical protein [Ruminococcus sp.]